MCFFLGMRDLGGLRGTPLVLRPFPVEYEQRNCFSYSLKQIKGLGREKNLPDISRWRLIDGRF